jgi:hypothetical protein
LSREDEVFVRLCAGRIHTRLKRTVEEVVAFGVELLAVKEGLQHGTVGAVAAG